MLLLIIPEQEPLYLPGNSELRVSIWRLTDQRRVWYEWYAEAFMSVMIALPDLARDSSSDVLLPISSAIPPSPTVDALDVPPIVDKTEIPTAPKEASSTRVVKIGQTALHNPGGRSSWIGL
jgi:type II protein arginine methyltransferase